MPPTCRRRPMFLRHCKTAQARPRAQPMAVERRRHGRAAVAGVAAPAPALASQPAQAIPAPRTFTEVVALLETKREARLVHHMMHHVHEVRCEPGLIEFRPEPSAPKDLAAKL